MWSKDSAFGQHQKAMEAAAGIVDDENNFLPPKQQQVDSEPGIRLELHVLERWAGIVDDMADLQRVSGDRAELIDLSNEIRSYFSG